MLYIENNSKFEIKTEKIESVYQYVLDKFIKSNEKEINVFIETGDIIKNLNYKYRGNNKATDVLSFKYSSDLPILGDIIIDIEVANKQKGNNSLEEEMQILFLHGFLHLLGYDHIKTSDAIEMNRIENEIYIKIIKES